MSYPTLRRRNRLSTSAFFNYAGIGPDTRFCVHLLLTAYEQLIHSLLDFPPEQPEKRRPKIVPKYGISRHLIVDWPEPEKVPRELGMVP
jgi:hypothetical protein